MSYNSRVYRQRNAHVHDEVQQEPFFSKQNDISKSHPKSAFFQAKLTVNKPGDSYEQEADSVASAVVNRTTAGTVVQNKKISSIQRLATPIEDEKLGTNDARMAKDKEIQEMPIQRTAAKDPEKEKLDGIQKKGDPLKEEEDKSKNTAVQAKPEAAATTAPSQVTSKIESAAGKGNALPAKAQQEMSDSFGVDFSSVRIHNDSEAAGMNKELQAQAFTHGSDIYFNEGKFDPESARGKFLLAHELTHVVQQNSDIKKKSIQRTIGDTNDLSSPRFKGNVDLEACFDGEKIIKSGANGDHVRLIQQALIDAGFPLPKFGADGKYGNETAGAVREFQKQSGLEFAQQDGQVGPNTMSRLDSRFTGASSVAVEKPCEKGMKTINVDFVKMKGATGSPSRDIAFANSVYKKCCVQFAIGKEVTVPDSVSDTLLGEDTDFLVGDCDTVSSEDLVTFTTTSSLFGLSGPIIAIYVDTLHKGTGRLAGDSVSGLCATGPRKPMEGMVSVANGADSRTLPHELAHVLMNTFADHRVTKDNLQHISDGGTGENIAPVQCAIMYTRAK